MSLKQPLGYYETPHEVPPGMEVETVWNYKLGRYVYVPVIPVRLGEVPPVQMHFTQENPYNQVRSQPHFQTDVHFVNGQKVGIEPKRVRKGRFRPFPDKAASISLLLAMIVFLFCTQTSPNNPTLAASTLFLRIFQFYFQIIVHFVLR